MRKGSLHATLQAGKKVKGAVKAIMCMAGILLSGQHVVAQTTTFSYTGTVQSYTVPAGVTTCTITCSGAQGGNSTSPSQSGGHGAIMSGVFTVTPGHVLNILVGQQPASCQYNAGGGGGSFVWDVTASNTLLIAAGGGGGANGNVGSGVNGLDASTGTSGVLGGNATGGAGTGGNGASSPTGSSFWGGGGAGWNSNGANGTSGGCALTSTGGTKPLSGGAGGAQGGTNISPPNGNGGFGGGGGGQGLCGNTGGAGGGGGYSGGTSGTVPSATQAQPGGGGGSFNSGSSQSNSVGNTGNGVVTIATPVTLLSISSVSPNIANTGSSVTISGANFSSTSGNDLVTFGGALATVTSASTSSLTVTVPTGALYGPVSITNTALGQTAYQINQQFLPTWSGPASSVSFNTHVDFTNSGLAGMALGDLDGDGKLDMVVSKQGSNIVQVYFNTSTSGSITTGSFASPVSFGAGSGPAYVAIADLDGDGKPEIIASDFGSNTIAILRNTATSGSITAGSFASAVTFTVGSSPEGIAVGDIDGDGKPDLAVLNQTLGTMSLLQNTSTTGTISFNPQVVFTTGSVPFFISMADIDGDGKLDIIETNFNSNNFEVFRNTATSGVINSGSLASPLSFTANSETIGLAVVDMDGDGKQDVVVSNFGAANLSVFRNTSTSGSVSFATKVDISALTAPIELGVADINGDGKPDIISGQGSGGSQVSYFPNTSTSGSVSFGTRMNMSAGLNPEWLTVGDLDGDGKEDIAVVNVSGTAGTSVIRNAAALNFAPTFTGGSPQNLNVCQNSVSNDINSLLTINDPDVGQTETWTVISGPSHGSVGTGATQTSTGGSVTPTGFSYTPNSTYSGPDAFVIQVSDGNGGTATTTINVTVNAMPAAITGPSVVCIGSTITLLNTSGGGTWTSSNTAIATVGTGSGVVTGVASGNATISYTLTGNCSATYSVAVSPIPSVTSVSPTSGIPGTSVTITGTNFNSTTTNDIVYFGSVQATVTAASGTSLTVTVPNEGAYYPVITVENNSCSLLGWAPYPFLPTFNNTGFVPNTTNFDAPVTYSTGSFPNQMTYGDIDGDGEADIIVSNYNSGTILAYRNTSSSGTISFAAPVTIVTVSGFVLGRPSVGDIDGDGKLDVVYMTATGPAVMGVLRNTSTSGSISFAAPVTVGYFTNADCSAIADIDGDGKADVIGNYLSHISVFRNTSSVGSISFASRIDFTAAGIITGIVAGNIDGDTKPDIALTLSNGTTSLSIFRNTSTPGSVSFAARQDFTTINNGNGGSTTIRLADIDGDGLQDVLMSSSGNVSIYPNTSTVGAISLGTRVDVSGAGGGSLSIGDFNGDSKPDVVTSSASPFGVLLNTSSGPGSFTFAPAAKFTTGTQSSGVVAIDMDGDGIPDVAVTEQNLNRLSLFRNDPLYPITGTPTACPGSTTTLSDATPGGKWVSSNPAVATVGSSTGIVTGVTTGTAIITYEGTASTVSATNIATVTVTINANPSGITGTTNVCTGATTTLSDATGGGNWSSSNGAIATVGSTGTVSGLTAGVVTISYTLPSTGCYATTAFTVNQSPTPVSGSFAVCVGASNTLTDGYSGGTWTSSATGVATIGSTSGVLTGVSAGNSTIVYTMPGSCSVSQQVTVNSNPAAITGLSNICVGTTTTLLDVTSGGLWGSSAPSVATITPGSGVVVGAAAGTTTMTYTLSSTGCFAIYPMTVNANPAAITGTASVCVGLTTVLSDATAGGTWSSSAPAIAPVVTGTVTGSSAGTANISYTIPSTGCFATTVVTVNANPVAITGTGTVCVGATTVLSDATGAGTWSSSNSSLASIGSGTGVVTGVGAGNPVITYTLPTGCINTTTITVNPLPAVITGIFTACPGTSAGLSSTSGGGTWTSNNTAVAIIGSASGTYTGVAAGTTTITYTLPTGCFTTTTITINPNPAAITGTASVCIGATTTLADGTSGGTWSSSSGAATVGGGTGVVTGVSAGNPTITYALPTGCIATVTATVNPLPLAIGGATSVCVGSTATVTDGSGTSTWSSSNTALATVGSGTGIVSGITSGTLNITFTLPTGCYVTTPFTVNTTPAAVSGTPNVCVGSTTALTDATSGGTWSSSNTGLATVGSTGIVSGGTAGTLNIIYTLPGGCTAVMPFTVNTTPAPIGGTFTVCTGSSATLTDATGGGTWSSSNTGLATVGTSGSVTGVSAGTPVITYMLAAGSCFVTQPVTVNTTPPANTGSPVLCAGNITTLANSVGGGSWSSLAPSVAIVGPTGVVNGLVPGTAPIVYTVTGGCTATTVVTVNNAPSTITGTFTVCTGQTTTLNNGVSGGTWSSSNTSVATVGSAGSSTTVTGVATGTAIISYTLPGGCFSTATVTVNQSPTAIVGSNNLCIGVSTTMTNGIGGGTWASSNTALATIGSSSGIALGSNTGTLNISYTLSTGCFAVLPVTVNTQPAAITGTTNVCVGTSVTLSDVTPSGTWSSSNTAVATVGSAGSVTGGSAGTVNISYTLAGGCFSVQPMTVNASPAAIGGTAVVCVGSTTTLTDATPGGTWSSSNTALGTVSSTGIVTGIAAGNPIISYTLSPGGCASTVTLTVNATPTAFSVTGGGSYCSGGSGVAVGLSNSTSGVNYQLWKGTTPVGSAVAGTGAAISFGSMTVAGTYTVVATNATTGCSANMTGSATVTVNPLPFTYTVSGGGSYCSGGSGVHVFLSGSAIGVTYTLYNGVTPVSGAVAGTGISIDYGLETATGTYTVQATNVSTGCVNTMTGSAIITINPLPNAYAVTVTGGGGYCAGGTGQSVGLAASDVSISYQLFRTGSAIGTPLAGTGASLNFGLQTVAGTYTIVGTNVTTGCVNSMTGSAVITINPLPTVYAVTGGGGYCIGGTGMAVGLSGSTSGISYQLWRSGVFTGTTVTGTGGAISFGLQTLAGTYTVVAINTVTGCQNNMSGSATVAVNPLPTAFNVTGGGNYCAGGTGVHIGLNGSTIGVSYQLMNGASPVGGAIAGTGSPLDFGLITGIATYTVVATNSSTGCVNNMTGSATVGTNPLPTAFAVTGGGGYCVGGSGVPVGLASSTAGISYQLYNGITGVGAPIVSTGGAIAFGNQTAAGTYTVIGTDPVTLCTAVMTGSAVVSVNALPTAYSVVGGGSYCAGGTGVNVGLGSSDVGVSYQLQLGGVNVAGALVAGTGSAISFGLQTAAGIYTVVAQNGTTTCSNNMTGSVTITINPLPIAYTVTGGGGYCTGGTGVHVGLSASNLGINYQLYNGTTAVGGPIAGTNSPLDFGLMTATGTYTVSATSASTGCTSNMTGSVAVSTIALPAIQTVSGGGSLCAGGAGVGVNVGPTTEIGVNYQLYNGTTAVGAALPGNAGVVTFPAQTTAGTYTVIATNGSGCTSNMAGSATVVVNPLPSAYTVTGGGNYCVGGTGVSIGLSGSEPGVTYQLFNPAPVLPTVAGTGFALTLGVETTTGIYTVIATNTTTGCTKTMTGTAIVGTNALPTAYAVTGGGSYCTGGTGVSVGLASSQLGINYQLYNGATAIGSSMPGTTGPINFGLQTAAGTYSVQATNASTGCTSNMTGAVTVAINSLPTVYAVTGGGSYCPGGSGVTVGLNNSDAGTNYQLYLGGVAVPGATASGTGSAISFGLQTALGTYTVGATNGSGCVDNMSGSATVANYPLPSIHNVTGGGSYCAGGTGVAVGLNGSNTGIVYQLLNTGSAVGIPIPGTGSAVTFGLQTASGAYTVTAMNTITGCVDTMLDSAVININTPPAVQTITGGGTYCVGGSGVSVALTGSEFGVSYQLYYNGAPTGAPIMGTGLGFSFGTYTAAGVYTIVGTNTTTLCTSTMAGADTISLNPPPTAYTVTGGGGYCTGDAGVHVGISNSQVGTNYTLYNGTTPAAPPFAGTGSAIDFGLYTAAGIYTVKAVNTSTGCTNNMLASAVVAINPLPTAFNMTGGGGYCSGATTGVHVGLSGSASGIRYQLYNGLGTVGAPLAGTGSALDFGVFTATGTYTVKATNPVTGCSSVMTGTSVVTVNALPSAYAVTGSGTSYCAGGTGINVYLSGSQTGVSYQLYRGATPVGIAIPGSATALDFGPQTIAGTYTVVASNTSTSCTSNMTGSATVTIAPLPNVFTVIGGGSYCPGGTGVHVGLSGSNTGIRYQLYLGSSAIGSPVNGTGSPIDFGLKTTTGTYTVVATNITTGCTNNMTGSANVVLNPLPVTFAVTGGGSYCAGGAGVSVGLAGSVSGTNYQLYFGSTPVGGTVAGTGTAISFGTQTFAGTYTVTAVDVSTSCSSNMSGSATVAINALPTVYTVMGGGNYCPGGSGVHIRLSNSDTGVNYQLYYGSLLSGSPVTGTGSSLDFGSFTGVGTYMVVGTNRTTGCVSNMSGGANVGLNPLPTVYNVIGGGNYCAGGTGVHIGLSGSSAGISYQLYKGSAVDGSPVIGTGVPVDFGLKTDSGRYTVVAANSATTCTSNMTGSATITVNPVVVPTLSISTGGSDSACAGNNVTFSAVATGTGSTPAYQWTVNGAVASTGSSYTYMPANNDVVSLTLTSSAVCASPASLSSSVTMTVLPKLMPSVNITALPGVIVCQGTVVNFTANTTTAGSAPTFLWLKNGLHVGASSTFTDIPSNGDQIECVMTSSYYCSLAATVTSPKVIMEVDTPVTPRVSVTVSPGLNIYPGENTTFTAHLANTVPYPSYAWYVNGVPQSTTTPVFSTDALNDQDVITCQVTSGGGCAGQTSSASVTIHVMNVGVKQITTSGMDVKLVPNPNKGIFTIKGSLGIVTDEEVSVEITDMLGQVIYTSKVIARNGVIDEKIQLNGSIANGMYLLSLHTGGDSKVFHMVVEQ